MDIITTSTLCIGGAGMVSAVALALADRYLTVPEDERIGQVTELLPGANCGGCGFAGCADYARAIVEREVACNLCPPGGSSCAEAIATLLGRSAAAVERLAAVVLCCGNDAQASRRAGYNGIADCAAVNATAGGDKACSYGCLGYASCSRVCPVNAIAIVDGVAVVDQELCIACGKCVAVCPRKLIKLVPVAATIHVLCSSKARGPAVKQVCKTGCIGCRICTKFADGAIAMDGFLAVVDYSLPLSNEETIAKCPAHCIRTTPTPAQKT